MSSKNSVKAQKTAEKNILLLSWHPGSGAFQTAGGFKRAYEMAKRCPNDVNLVCLDKFPSYFNDLVVTEDVASNGVSKDLSHIKIDTYNVPKFVTALNKVSFVLRAAVEKFYVSFAIFFKVARNYKDFIIYVPYSELMQLSFGAILCKWFFKNRIVFANLNVNHFFPENILNPWLHKFSDLNITISKDLQADLQKNGIDCTVINPVGIDLDYSKKFLEQDKVHDAIFIGRHTKEKGIFDALEVCAKLNQDGHDFKLVTIGNIPQNNNAAIEKKIEELGIKEKVFLKGMVSEEDKYKYIKQSKMCFFPSYQEGWGIVPQEAITCGVPVVAYSLEVYKENIWECKAVKFADIGDKNQYASLALEWLGASRDHIEDSIKQSMQILQNFSWDSVSKKEYTLVLESK